MMVGWLLLSIFCWILVSLLFLNIFLRLFYYDKVMYSVWANMYFKHVHFIWLPVFIYSLGVGDWIMTGASIVLGVHYCVNVLPDYLTKASIKVDDSEAISFYSANLLMVNPDPLTTTMEILEEDADVVMLTEYSRRWHQSLEVHGVVEKYPYKFWLIREDSFGSAIFSKYPFEEHGIWEIDDGCPISVAVIKIGASSLKCYNIHTYPPRLPDYTVSWNKQNETLKSAFVDDLESGYSLVVAGDFNATQYNKIIRDLVTESHLVNCHYEMGKGSMISFPNGVFKVPPARLDHAFHSLNLKCISLENGRPGNSDHLPIKFRLVQI